MAIANSKSEAELKRIRWRQRLLLTQEGRQWLCDQVRNRKTKEKDLGPHRFVSFLPPEE